MLHPTYDTNKSYIENYNSGPEVNFKIPKRVFRSTTKIWGFTLNSPIGVPAGPLLNSKYIELYSKLGFDIPVYKTVRTISRNSHAKPNCLMIDSSKQLTEKNIGQDIYPSDSSPKTVEEIAITNSFGIPSQSIEVWQKDIEKANKSLSKNQVMIVSCVGTPLEERDIINDFVFCAQKAIEAGARAIELNYSCPNVLSKEGSIYQDPSLSSTISQAVKRVIGHTPLMIKIGYIPTITHLENIIRANAPYIDGIAAINTISMKARSRNNDSALLGEGRLNSGICGSIIKDLALKMTGRINKIRQEGKYDFVLCGVGGIVKSGDINDYLDAGADIIMSGTGAMWNPLLAHEWQKQKTKLQ
jgi:dihydroorotate dehydrogenase